MKTITQQPANGPRTAKCTKTNPATVADNLEKAIAKAQKLHIDPAEPGNHAAVNKARTALIKCLNAYAKDGNLPAPGFLSNHAIHQGHAHNIITLAATALDELTRLSTTNAHKKEVLKLQAGLSKRTCQLIQPLLDNGDMKVYGENPYYSKFLASVSLLSANKNISFAVHEIKLARKELLKQHQLQNINGVVSQIAEVTRQIDAIMKQVPDVMCWEMVISNTSAVPYRDSPTPATTGTTTKTAEALALLNDWAQSSTDPKNKTFAALVKNTFAALNVNCSISITDDVRTNITHYVSRLLSSEAAHAQNAQSGLSNYLHDTIIAAKLKTQLKPNEQLSKLTEIGKFSFTYSAYVQALRTLKQEDSIHTLLDEINDSVNKAPLPEKCTQNDAVQLLRPLYALHNTFVGLESVAIEVPKTLVQHIGQMIDTLDSLNREPATAVVPPLPAASQVAEAITDKVVVNLDKTFEVSGLYSAELQLPESIAFVEDTKLNKLDAFIGNHPAGKALSAAEIIEDHLQDRTFLHSSIDNLIASETSKTRLLEIIIKLIEQSWQEIDKLKATIQHHKRYSEILRNFDTDAINSALIRLVQKRFYQFSDKEKNIIASLSNELDSRLNILRTFSDDIHHGKMYADFYTNPALAAQKRWNITVISGFITEFTKMASSYMAEDISSDNTEILSDAEEISSDDENIMLQPLLQKEPVKPPVQKPARRIFDSLFSAEQDFLKQWMMTPPLLPTVQATSP
ncbi:hypothetical protein [Paraburkholderia hayleyella]|uniref:hypothetical protein n=1 Tax=Paraburkholderia hayleyella TaxID=2152889 RepID=UPI001291C0FB|nr:hypothetical protein [Paraburkholderia hayleyella]